MTIDWSKFTNNVKSFLDARDKTTKEVLEQYEMVSKKDKREFAKLAPDQPSPAQRSHMVWAVLHQLNFDDERFMYESIEGDYCMWAVHLADKLERTELPNMTAGDWQFFANFPNLIEMMVDCEDPEKADEMKEQYETTLRNLETYGIMEIAKKYENERSIFSTVLC